MDVRARIVDAYISLVERIANGRSNVLELGGDDFRFFRGEIHLVKRIGDHPGSSSSELARAMGVTRAVVHKTLLKLEERGLVRKGEDGENRKRVPLFLTDRGEEAYRLHARYHEERDGPFFDFIGALNDEEARLIEAFLERAREMISRHF